MALATAIAAAISMLRPACAGLLVMSLLVLSTAALAADRVYIWRDANGAVRFSAVAEPARDTAGSDDASAALIADADAAGPACRADQRAPW